VYERILVPVDFSDHSKAVVKWIPTLKQLGLKEVYLLHVLDELKIEHPAGGYDVTQLMEDYMKEAKEKLREYSDLIGGKLKVNICAIWAGDPATIIVKQAEELNVDLIVMPTAGKGWFKELILGSTSRKVARLSTKPVLLVKKEWMEEERDYNFDHIMVSGWIDDPGNTSEIELIKCELEESKKLARAFYENTGVKPLIRVFAVLTRNDKKSIPQLKNTLEYLMENGNSYYNHDVIVWIGDPVEDLKKAAASFDADVLIVSAKKAYKGLSLGWRLTSLLASVDIPIYVCK